MFNGKRKAITFSYDDGVTQDVRLIDILNRYHLRATFNLNSELLGTERTLVREGVEVSHNKNKPADVPHIYAGHEIAAHTLTHPTLTQCADEEIIRQVEQDRQKLSDLAGYAVVGMAYPGGGVNHSDHIAELIRKNTGIRYARTNISTHAFTRPENPLLFHPSVYHIMELDKLFALGEQFLAMDAATPQVFCVWGHSYEFDIADTWGKFEEFCQMISNRDDIFYGTNKEVLLK